MRLGCVGYKPHPLLRPSACTHVTYTHTEQFRYGQGCVRYLATWCTHTHTWKRSWQATPLIISRCLTRTTNLPRQGSISLLHYLHQAHSSATGNCLGCVRYLATWSTHTHTWKRSWQATPLIISRCLTHTTKLPRQGSISLLHYLHQAHSSATGKCLRAWCTRLATSGNGSPA